MQCKEWDDANSELFKESHDEAVHKNSYKSRLYELISASLANFHGNLCIQKGGCEKCKSFFYSPFSPQRNPVSSHPLCPMSSVSAWSTAAAVL